MDTRPIFLTDLDDFLFNLKHKCVNAARQISTTESGQPQSFMNATQIAFFNWLFSSTRVVPVTGRSFESFSRIGLPFTSGAILAFGGIILRPDGSPDPIWLDRIKTKAAAESGRLQELKVTIDATAERLQSGLAGKIVSSLGVEQYVKVVSLAGKSNVDHCQVIADDLRQALPAGWQIHHNNSQVCAMPPFLRKELAVQYFLENIAGEFPFVIGGGDSLSDLGFINMAHYGLFPNPSQALDNLALLAAAGQ